MAPSRKPGKSLKVERQDWELWEKPLPSFMSYAKELLDCAAATRRLDANVPVCKAGKLCNGRCIPHSHQCGGGGGGHQPSSFGASAGTTTRVEIEKKYGHLSDEQKNKLAETMDRLKQAKAKREQYEAGNGTLPQYQASQKRKAEEAMKAHEIRTASEERDRNHAAATNAVKQRLAQERSQAAGQQRAAIQKGAPPPPPPQISIAAKQRLAQERSRVRQ